MKTLFQFLGLLLLPFISYSQTQETHAKVAIQIDRANMVTYLNQNGLEIDHSHSHHPNEIEVTIPISEVTLLNDLGVDYEVLIPDVAADYVRQVNETASTREVGCGLINFDEGTMGVHHTYAEMQMQINSMATQFPELVNITEIGTSVEGRTIFAVKISDNVLTDESATEGVAYYDAITHAREPMGLESVLYYMWTLLENYNADPELTYLVNNREMYFVPIVNPDGYVYNQTTDPNGGGFWRKNRRDNGNGCFGIDLNRNYSYGWGDLNGSSNDPCSDLYHGTLEFSEPETQAIRDFTTLIQPAAAFSCHSYSDVFLCPNGFNDELDRYDLYSEFASEFTPPTYNGYGNWVQTIGYYGAGNTHDFLNNEGVVAYTPEIGHSFWESPSVVCDRVQEMLPAMKYMSWVAGAYTCFHDFEIATPEIIWPNYTTSVNIRVKNRGLSKTAENVSIELNSTHTAVTIINGTADLGDIAARQFSENTTEPLIFTVDNTVVLGERIPFEVTVYQDGAVSYEDVIYLHAGRAEVLFTEDGENGLDQWANNGDVLWDTTFVDAVGGGHCVADTRYGNISEGTTNTIESLTGLVNLQSASQPWLEFSAKWSFQPFASYAQAYAKINSGASPVLLQGLHTTASSAGEAFENNKHWVQERMDLSSFAGFSDVSVGFVLDATSLSVRSDGFYFDDLRVVEYVEPIGANTENITKAKFELFPNPANDVLSIQLENTNSGFVITLLDLQGRSLWKKSATGSSGSISLDGVAAGLYLVKVSTDDFVGVEKLIIKK